MTECPHHEKIDDKCNQIDSLFSLVNEKIGLKSLIPIMGVVVIILGIFITILHDGYKTTIKVLTDNQISLSNIVAEQEKEKNKIFKSIEVSIAVMQTDIAHMKNGKK